MDAQSLFESFCRPRIMREIAIGNQHPGPQASLADCSDLMATTFQYRPHRFIALPNGGRSVEGRLAAAGRD
jgi:hypothetical protein